MKGVLLRIPQNFHHMIEPKNYSRAMICNRQFSGGGYIAE